MKNLFIGLGLILIIAAGVWKFALVGRFEPRFYDGWTWDMHTLGKGFYLEAPGDSFPEGTTLIDDPSSPTDRVVTASSDSMTNGQILLTDSFVSRDPVTDAITWEYSSTAVVNQTDGRLVDGEFAGDYFLLPRNLDRGSSYIITNANYHHLEMQFQSVEEIAGIETYLYAFYGDFHNPGYPDMELEENQEIICFDLALEYWVEPATGEILKYREWCEGDWVVDKTTQEKVYVFDRWGSESTPDDLLRRAGIVRAELNKHNWLSLYIPIIGALLGLGLLLYGIFGKRASLSEKA